jgi:acyl-CoA synthetase (AMP-forming)/AMP-acid ligase II
VQFSSGSTGNPKGVILTHKNLIANIKAISKASSYFENDSKLSWMPITHDMGLIGFHLCPLFLGMNHYLIPTNLFIRRPSLWLEKASQHKVSILCSPNFGYQYLLKHYDESFDYKWNLSHVRIIYNGAEPISEGICHDFLNALSCYGLNKTSMCPVYGLAEASVAVSISKIDKEVISVNVDRNNLTVGSTITNNLGSESSISFINVGVAIDNCSLRITDVEGKLSAAKINLLQNLR